MQSISDPKRLFRLLIAACLAYIWMICLGVHAHMTDFLGVHAHMTDMVSVIHRTARCDLSLFRVPLGRGLDLLHYWLEEELDILVSFRLPLHFMFTQLE